jgi:hypothetical protein
MHSWGSRSRRFKSGRPDWSEAGSGFQLPVFGCNGSARAPIHSTGQAEWRALPCKHPDQRLLAISASRGLVPALPAPPRVSFPPGQGVAGSGPAVKGWFGATTAAEGRRRPAATTLSRLDPRRPATSTARAFRCSLPPPTVSYADLPTGGHSAAVAIVTDGDNLHRVAPVCPATDRLCAHGRGHGCAGAASTYQGVRQSRERKARTCWLRPRAPGRCSAEFAQLC